MSIYTWPRALPNLDVCLSDVPLFLHSRHLDASTPRSFDCWSRPRWSANSLFLCAKALSATNFPFTSIFLGLQHHTTRLFTSWQPLPRGLRSLLALPLGSPQRKKMWRNWLNKSWRKWNILFAMRWTGLTSTWLRSSPKAKRELRPLVQLAGGSGANI